MRGFLGSLFKGGAKDILEGTNNILDKVVTNDTERSNAKEELSEVVLNALNRMQEAQKEVLLAEMKGNWLQRSWRPMVMLTFTAMIVAGAFTEIPYLADSSPFWSLLKIGLGGYVIGRSVEKVTKNVTANIDLPFLRKKERKYNIVG